MSYEEVEEHVDELMFQSHSTVVSLSIQEGETLALNSERLKAQKEV